MSPYYVYMMSSKSGTLYIGVTNDLQRRVLQHQGKLVHGFMAKYNITKLIWFEEFSDVNTAILCEKQLKGWRRSKKVDLVQSTNPSFSDLSNDWSDLNGSFKARDSSLRSE